MVDRGDAGLDAGSRSYKGRFEFALISESPLARPSWRELQARLLRKVTLQVPRDFSLPADEATLAALFDPATDDGAGYGDEDRAKELEALGFDTRVFDLRAIVRRQGQPQFRASLLQAYRGACAITGATTEDVLEAAHISPFKGSHTNRVDNGLLLRSDVHTLFDRLRITVLPDFTVSVDPVLRDGDYQVFNGRALSLPSDPSALPDKELLAQHNKLCRWELR